MAYSISKMLNKQNQSPPKKQGILYSITTGKNNGVYLPKDISCENHKSLKLLTKQAQQSHKSYVQSLKLVQRQQKECKTTHNLIQVQSFNQKYDFNMMHLSTMRSSLQQSTIIHKHMHIQLTRLKQKILQQNTQLQQSALPALKSLKQKIKLSKQEQSASYSKMHRELQKIEQCFGVVAGGIKQCQRKLEISQANYKGDQFDQ